MDDYNIASLSESKNEWCARLVNAMTPAVIEGLRSIFKEASALCEREDQEDKYLMTFQTYLSRIPKWNEEIIKGERERIEERSRCGYLEDLHHLRARGPTQGSNLREGRTETEVA